MNFQVVQKTLCVFVQIILPVTLEENRKVGKHAAVVGKYLLKSLLTVVEKIKLRT